MGRFTAGMSFERSSLRFLLRSARPMFIAIAALGVGGAAVNAGLVAVVHRALYDDASRLQTLAIYFAGLALGKTVIGYASGSVMHGFAHETETELRRSLIGRILRVPYSRIETVGRGRLYSTLTYDVTTVSRALQVVPTLVVNCAVLAGGAAYLAYLDPRALGALLLAAVPGAVAYRLLSRRASAFYKKQRAERDRLYQHLDELIGGAKELKMHLSRRRTFLRDAVLPTTESMLEHELRGNARFLVGQAINGLWVLVIVGLVLFALPQTTSVSNEMVSGYVLTGLYLSGSLSGGLGAVRALPMFSLASLAMERIDATGLALSPETGAELEADSADRPEFSRLTLRDVCFRYAEKDGLETGFALRDVSLAVVPGEVMFIRGDNGSGKSTLAKVLCGLYQPGAGELRWDGNTVTSASRDAYRQLWSAVFAEFHLFERLYGLDPDEIADRAQGLIDELGLTGAVELTGSSFSSTALSSGQRRRLALLVALLEDRPAYLFDEWASDQDPDFRRRFYCEIVPRLKAAGKAVVVITHDDRYFDQADQVVEMRHGGIVRVQPAARIAR